MSDPNWSSVVLAMHMDDSPLADLKGHAITTVSGAARSGAQYADLTGNAYSCSFNGSGGKLTTPNSADFDFGTGAYTIDLWFRATDISGNRTLVSNNTFASGVDKGFNLYAYDGQLGAYWNDGSGNFGSVTSSTYHTANTWNHVEWSSDGTTVRLFLNGSQVASTTTNPTIRSSPQQLSIGVNYYSDSYSAYWAGYIDDLRITKGVRRNSSGFSVPTAPFEEGAGSVGDAAGTSTVSGASSISIPPQFDANWSNVVLAMHMDDTGLTDLKSHTITATGVSRSGASYAPLISNIYAALWDGSTTSRLSTPNSSDFNFGSGAWTVGMWCRATNSSGAHTLLSNFSDADAGSGIYRGVIIDTYALNPSVTVYPTTGSAISFSSSINLTINQWHYIEVSSNGSTIKLFIDGTQRGSASIGYAIRDSGYPLIIGAKYSSAGGYQFGWVGSIDDLVITKGVQRHASDFTSPIFPFGDYDANVGNITGTSSAAAAGANAGVNVVSGAGSSVGTSSVSGAHARSFGGGGSIGTTSVAGVFTQSFGRGISTGTTTVDGVRSPMPSPAMGLANGWSVATAYTYRDKGAGNVSGTSSAVAYNLVYSSRGRANGGSSVDGYSFNRTGAGACQGTSSAAGVNPYRPVRGAVSGSSAVVGRSRSSASGRALASSAASGISRSSGSGQATGSSAASSTCVQSFGSGLALGTSLVTGVSLPTRVYPEVMSDLSFARTKTLQSRVVTQ